MSCRSPGCICRVARLTEAPASSSSRSAGSPARTSARTLLFLIVAFFSASQAEAQKGRVEVEKGNRQFEAGEYEQARDSYRRALEQAPASAVVNFNLGDSQYKLNEFPDAQKRFMEATQGGNPELLAEAHYNLANSFFKQGKLEESIEAYKQALRLSPADQAAKHNLELALRRREEQQQQQNQPDQQNQDQSAPEDQEDQENRGNQENQESQEDQEGQDPQDSRDSRDSQNESQQDSQDSSDQDPSQQPESQAGGEDNPADRSEDAGSQEGSPQEENSEDQSEPRQTDPAEDQNGAAGEAETKTDPVPGRLTREEAARLLAAIQEDLQTLRREQLKKLKRNRAEKDW